MSELKTGPCWKDGKFIECAECIVKPGSPDLCAKCLEARNIGSPYNKKEIEVLSAARYQIDLWDFYFSSAVNGLLTPLLSAGDSTNIILDKAEKIADQMALRSVKRKQRPVENVTRGIS